MKKIVIDTLLSDNGEEEIAIGAIESSKKNPQLKYVLVGIKSKLEKLIVDRKANLNQFEIIDSIPLPSNIHSPLDLLRYKGESSLISSMKELNEDKDTIGMISSGPTGMLLVSAIKKVGLVEGVEFPCLACLLKNIKMKDVLLLDCGANVDVNASRLVQFAQMGSALMKSYYNIDSPRIGLLNVGKEDSKGDALRKETFKLLKETDLNFYGNIEGSDAFLDKVDVVVCDGFSGNVLLKNAEAVGMICKKIVEMNDSKSKAQQDIYNMFAYTDLGGAIIIGTNKLIIKAHGAANRNSIDSIISLVLTLDKNNYLENINKALKK